VTRLRQETTRSYIHAVKERWKNSRLATITMEVLRAQQSSTLATMFFDHRACILVVSQTSKLCMAQGVDLVRIPGSQLLPWRFCELSSPQPSPPCSLITVRASLSSRKPANFAWRKGST
jgi:hypothetical protein